MIPVIAWLLVRDTLNSNLWAAVLLVVAAFTDLLDGLLARLLNQQSDLGKLLDPLADKLFAASFVIVLLLIRDFPLWFLILIIAKDLAIAIGGYYVMKKHDIVMQSKLVGKYAFASQVMLIISYYIRFPFGQWFFTATTLFLIAATMASYYYSFRRQVAGKSAGPDWSKQINRFFLFIRLWLVFLGASLVLVHGYVWLFESPYSIKGNEVEKPVVPGDAALAEKYAPVLIIPETVMTPANPDAYFAEARFRAGTRFFVGYFDGDISRAEALQRNDAYISTSVPQSAERSKILAYWHTNQLPANSYQMSKAITYWYFFEKQNIPVYREGIWRAFVIYLDKNDKPGFVATNCEWYMDIEPWQKVEILHDHPTLYLGKESHAFSLKTGEIVQSLGPARIIDISRDVAEKGRHFHAGVEYQLQQLTPETEWYSWRGLWGGPAPGGDLGPRWWNPKNTNATLYERPLKVLKLFLDEQGVTADSN